MRRGKKTQTKPPLKSHIRWHHTKSVRNLCGILLKVGILWRKKNYSLFVKPLSFLAVILVLGCNKPCCDDRCSFSQRHLCALQSGVSVPFLPRGGKGQDLSAPTPKGVDMFKFWRWYPNLGAGLTKEEDSAFPSWGRKIPRPRVGGADDGLPWGGKGQ